MVLSTVIMCLMFLSISSFASSTQSDYSLTSPNPYPNNYDNGWVVSKEGASRIRVHFVYIETEKNFDFVTSSAGDSWTGNYGEAWSNWSNASSIRISLNSDVSAAGRGFKIDKIEYETTDIVSNVSQAAYNLQSAHPYRNFYSNTWKITQNGATKIRVHFANISTETDYDYVKLSNAQQYSGDYVDVWSNWVNADSISITLETDISIVKNGFVVDKIEYVMPTQATSTPTPTPIPTLAPTPTPSTQFILDQEPTNNTMRGAYPIEMGREYAARILNNTSTGYVDVYDLFKITIPQDKAGKFFNVNLKIP